ncbi:MAG: MFS transporter, partial [Janthinobacterium lividum]
MSTAMPVVVRARTAVYSAFALNGFFMASWVSRIPSVRDTLGLSAGGLSVLLLSLSLGSVIAMPLAGAVVLRIGRARTVFGGALAISVGLLALALAVDGLRLVPLAAAGLFVAGAGTACWDVSMNVEGSAVERRLDRAIMSRFHASWSLGTVVSAGVGVLLLALGVATWVHLCAVAVLVVVGAGWATRHFLDSQPSETDGRPAPAGIGLGRAWREPRTLLIGVLVLCMAFVEGTANDWLA